MGEDIGCRRRIIFRDIGIHV